MENNMNIVLCGFMGCGKSTVGKILAEKTGYTLFDSDTCVEKREQMTVSEIFSRHGEQYFRNAEKEVIRELSEQHSLIIATGGGAVLDHENAETLRKNGLVIFLDVTSQTVLKRLEGDTTRPLLMREDKETAVNELMAYRRPIYTAAGHFSVCADGNPEATADEILRLYRDFTAK